MTSRSPLHETLVGLPGPALRRSLWERYVRLLDGGEPSDRVLVLLDGATRSQWRAWLRGLERGDGTPAVPDAMGGQLDHTPAGFIQQELRLWWGLAADGLRDLGAPVPTAHEPVFAAIDLAQYLMGSAIRHRRHDLEFLAGSHSATHYQHVQLLDALARGIEHGFTLASPADDGPAHTNAGGEPLAGPCLALAGAITARLREGGADPELMGHAREALALYLDGCLRSGVLDHALQLEVYASALWPQPRYQEALRHRFGHVLVEHLDELNPRWHQMLGELLAHEVRGCFTLQRDAAEHGFKGGLREYVGADPRGAWTLASTLTRVVPAAADYRPMPFAELGRALHAELTMPEALRGRPGGIQRPSGQVALSLDAYSPAEMLQEVADRVVSLLQTGDALPRHIALVGPTLSPLLIWSLRQKLAGIAPLYVFAGTNRLRDYRPVRVLITLAKLAHPAWGLMPTRYELLELLELSTGLNPLRLGRLMPSFFTDGRLVDPSVVTLAVPDLSPVALKRYAALVQWAERATPPRDLPTFFREVFARLYAAVRAPGGAEALTDESFLREVSQIGQLVELTQRFEAVDRRMRGEGDQAWALRFLAFLDDSPIAERPFFQREPHHDAVMLSTPSQLAERGFAGVDDDLRCLFLLDVGSEGWKKRDRRELTNARVLARGWPGGFYDAERELADMNEKLGRVLMACCLKARERLFVHGCLTDEEGRENQGELPGLLVDLLAEAYA